MRSLELLSKSLLLVSFLFIFSCSNNDKDGTEVDTLEDQAALSTKIDSLTLKLTESMDMNEAKQVSIELVDNCTKFVEVFPKDPRCADYLFISARASNGLGEYDKSLRIMETIKKGYNGYVKMPEVYFLYAFTLDEDLERKDDAKKAYMDLINAFPDSPLSSQSAMLLDQLYMSDEELIESWKMKEGNQ